MKKLPLLHEQAFKYKNTKRLQRDGGRAWIKDSQLHEARKDANGRFVTVPQKLKVPSTSTQMHDHNKNLPNLRPDNAPV